MSSAGHYPDGYSHAGHERRGPTPSTATCVPAPIDLPVLITSCMRVPPLLENDQVPERPGRVRPPLAVAADQPRNDVGIDLSLGVEYRPFLNNNVIVKGFGAILQPLGGFSDIFETNTLYQVGTEVVLVF